MHHTSILPSSKPCWREPVPGQDLFIFAPALASDTGSRSLPRGLLSNRQACELHTPDLEDGLGESSAIQLGKRMGFWENALVCEQR